ncbi:MAG: FAD-binding protein [Gammaproteobacteria bacterium]|nr:FAD-binding protein [Gammaproteobacteria bacterium]
MSTLPRAFLQRLQSILDTDTLLTEEADRWSYGYDNSRRHGLPDAVVLPTTHERVVAIVKLCNEFGIPMIPRGRGTGTTGATVPLNGGVVISLERMNRIVSTHPEDRYMVVEPGVLNKEVQDTAAACGFFWPPDPTSSAFCSIGGNLAYNSAGPRAVKYGTPRENVLGLRAVLGNGEELRTGVYTSKGVVGYDFTRLLIGSEGTLALITEATLKLTPLPEARRTLQIIYRDIDSAARAVSAIMAQPVVPYALEFIDGNAIHMIRDYSDAYLPDGAAALLMVEVDGRQSELEGAVEAIRQASQNEGRIEFNAPQGEAEIQALWATRKALSPALRTIAPKKINEDVVVPVSKIPRLINGLDELSSRFGIPIVNFGHAGNGNIHVNLLVNPEDEDEMAAAEACLQEVFTLVLSLDGTLSGEHGIGLEKQAYVGMELDATSVNLMHRVKQLFDPNGLLNPGKLPGNG